MSESEKMLLKYAYNNYLKNNDLECSFLLKDGNTLLHAISAAKSLQESGYIEVYSDNLSKSTFTLAKNSAISNDMIIRFSLTHSGLEFVRTNF